jgi:pyridoxamine--pyruvate transaminase
MNKWPVMNLAAGPVEVTNRTLRELARPVLFHYDPAFIELVERTCGLLQQVFRTQYDVVIMQGETVLGLEAAAAGLFSPGDKVLNLVSGSFGKKYENYIKKYGGEVIEVAVPYNDAVDPDDVRRALEQNPDVKFLSVVHSETPSTTLNPVEHIGPIAKEFGVITIVDTASGLGGEPLIPEEWGIDIAVAGPQKCLGGIPGLALMSVSPDAWRALEQRDPPLRGSYLSILDWKDKWIDNHAFPFTPLVSDFYALESTLSQVVEEGVDRFSKRHRMVARACREGVKAMGLELWVAREEIATSAVTGVKIPEDITDAELRGRMRETYGVYISGGFAETAGKLVRLGHMAKAAHPTYLAAQLAVLERTLADLGWPVNFGAGTGAAMAALSDWGDL